MKTLRNWLEEAPFTLALSSSFFGFYFHCGITAALAEAGLRPQKFTGSSAGALVGGGLASGLTSLELRDVLLAAKRQDFWDPRPGLGYLRGEKFRRLLEKSFAPSFDKTQTPLEVAAFDVLSLQTKFLNSGSLPTAVAASCAVPLMFHPVRIGTGIFYDGGVFRKSGLRHEQREERNLCIFIESRSWSRAYEVRLQFKNISPQHKILRFKNLPSVHFNSMEKGPLAFQAALEQARRSLDRPLENFLIDA